MTMDRREALKKMAVGGATIVGATAVMSSPAFAYGEPTNINVTFSLQLGAEGGTSGGGSGNGPSNVGYGNRKVAVRFTVTAKCGASSANSGDNALIQNPSSGTTDNIRFSVKLSANNSANVFFNYPSGTSPDWGPSPVANRFLTSTNITDYDRVYNSSANGTSSFGLNYTLRNLLNRSDATGGTGTYANYTPWKANETFALEFKFRLRCHPDTPSNPRIKTKFKDYKYTGTIRWNAPSNPETTLGSWSPTMALSPL